MGRFDSTKAAIDANIKKNDNREITGSILNYVMNNMVDATEFQLEATDVRITKVSKDLESKADKSEVSIPDWDAAENEAGYIKNRTHYKEAVERAFVGIEKGDYILDAEGNPDGWESWVEAGGIEDESAKVILPVTIAFGLDFLNFELTFDHVGQREILEYEEYEESYASILEVGIDEKEGECYLHFTTRGCDTPWLNDGEEIDVRIESFKRLNEGYIPSTIVRKSDLEKVSAEMESQNEMIEDLQNTKIDKEADDYYPQLSVGLADNLAGVDEVASEISFRRSGGGAISDGVARIEAIKGNSVVWNQSATSQGEVIHMDVQSLESVGVNQWDEEWESGGIAVNNGKPYEAVAIRSKNPIKVIPSAQYYCTLNGAGNVDTFYYDENDEYLGVETLKAGVNRKDFTIPNGAHYMRFATWDTYGTEYNHDICINLSDASINGKYFPYVKRTEDLSIIRKYFPQGMKSAGTAHDEIRYNKVTQKWEKVVRIGEVDMGSLALAYDSNNGGYFYAKLNGAKVPSSWREVGNILAAQYNATYADSIVATGATPFNMSMGIAPNGNIYFVNTAYTNAASFKAAMAGVILYYELAEPIVTEIEGDFNLDYEVWNGGTEEIVSDVPTTPLKADIAYGFNAVGKIKELEERINSGGGGGVSKEYVDTKVTELSAEVGKKVDADFVNNAIAEAIGEAIDGGY